MTPAERKAARLWVEGASTRERLSDAFLMKALDELDACDKVLREIIAHGDAWSRRKAKEALGEPA